MDRRFDCAHEPCSHVDPFCAQTQRCSETLPVCKTTRSYERNDERLSCPAEEDEIGNVRFPDMTGALKSIDGQKVNAELDCRLSVADCGAFVQDYAVSGFELFDHRSWAVSRSLDNLDPFFDDCFSVSMVVRRYKGGEEGKVDSKWVLSHCSTSPNFPPKIFWRRLSQSCDLDYGSMMHFESIWTQNTIQFPVHLHCLRRWQVQHSQP